MGPILEILSQHRRAGRIRVLGASNWSAARLEEAAAIRGPARARRLRLLEPRAEPGRPPGRALARVRHDPRARGAARGTRHRQLPVFAWASLAGGFFAGVRSADVLRVYENGGNRERLRRARALAARKGATASQVALAWVLHQPFPTYALIGPRSVAELRESVAALDLTLTPAESRWLDLEDDAA